MSAAKRKREVQVNFRVSPEELALIEQKMSQLGTVNREAYLRKMALTRGCSQGLGHGPNKQKLRFPATPGTAVSSLCGNKGTACYNGDTRFYIHFTIPLF